MIRLLLDAGADPNAADPTGETALMTAARVGTLDAVQLLLDRGAIVDAKDPTFQQTALMVAVRENHPDVVTLLVERGRAGQRQNQNRARPLPWILPNSVPGFGHGVGIVRGGLPDRGLRNSDSGRTVSALVRRARRPARHRANPRRGEGRCEPGRRQRHHAARRRDYEQPRRCRDAS